MLQKLTIKDFIKYNYPCKCCGAPTKCFLKIYQDAANDMISAEDDKDTDVIDLSMDVVNGLIEIPIQIKYKSKSYLLINPKTNEFKCKYVGEKFDIPDFLDKSIVWLKLDCKKCGTSIASRNLKFNEKNISPIEIMYEHVFVESANNKFALTSYFPEIIDSVEKPGITDILVSKHWHDYSDNDIFNMDADSCITVDIMPIGSFSSIEDLIKKLEMILMFR